MNLHIQDRDGLSNGLTILILFSGVPFFGSRFQCVAAHILHNRPHPAFCCVVHNRGRVPDTIPDHIDGNHVIEIGGVCPASLIVHIDQFSLVVPTMLLRKLLCFLPEIRQIRRKYVRDLFALFQCRHKYGKRRIVKDSHHCHHRDKGHCDKEGCAHQKAANGCYRLFHENLQILDGNIPGELGHTVFLLLFSSGLIQEIGNLSLP